MQKNPPAPCCAAAARLPRALRRLMGPTSRWQLTRSRSDSTLDRLVSTSASSKPYLIMRIPSNNSAPALRRHDGPGEQVEQARSRLARAPTLAACTIEPTISPPLHVVGGSAPGPRPAAP